MPNGASSSGGAISRPSNEKLAQCIEKLAARVAKVGPQFETMVLQKQGDNPEFAFLKLGGEGADYYQAQKESAMRLATSAAAPSYVRLRGLPRVTEHDVAQWFETVPTDPIDVRRVHFVSRDCCEAVSAPQLYPNLRGLPPTPGPLLSTVC